MGRHGDGRRRMVAGAAVTSDKGAEAGDGLADDEADMGFQQVAVGAEQLARPATVSRMRTVQMPLASDACSSFMMPCSCSCDRRRHSAWLDVMLPSMRNSRSWISWKEAIGLPNCSRFWA